MNSKKKLKICKIFSFKYFFYDFVKVTGALPMLLYLRPKRKYVNKKKCKALKKGFIVSANHQQFLDPILMMFAFPLRRTFFIAMEKIFDTPIKAWFFKHMQCIKVDRSNVGLDTIRNAGKALENEKLVCIFPEGKIVDNSDPASFKPGAAMMALLNDVPIVPLYIEKRRGFFHTVKLILGEPIIPSDVVGDAKSVKAIEKLNKVLFENEVKLHEYYESLYGRKESL